nr:serpin B6-like [Ciona intestinalis]|eukprot:XP_026693180.1 serpin B6-like [Ciona intestinalis]
MAFCKVAAAKTDFALGLYKELSQKEDGNLFFSPYSISTALMMTLLGSKENTREEMLDVLGLKDLNESDINSGFLQILHHLRSSRGDVVLEMANKLFPEAIYKLEKDFLSKCKEFYETEIQALDFKGNPDASREAINAWAEKETSGKIKDLLPSGSIDSLVRLVLANAVYFKGSWLHKFKEQQTTMKDFHIRENKVEKVNMMFMKRKFRFNFDQSLGLQVVEIPYIGNKLSMVVFLPTERFALNKIENALTTEKLHGLLAGLWEETLMLSLPRMKFEQDFDLGGVLKKMGMMDAFDERAANFEAISGSRDLVISKVVHKAFIEVNEEGSEAAAATAVVMMLRSMPAPPVMVNCDHPFLFLIRHNQTKTILFLGRFSGP